MASDTSRYGKYYWCVKVPKEIAPDREIYLTADDAQILRDGSLVFYHQKDETTRTINLALAPGKWIAFFGASVLDGHAVAVDHWRGEVTDDDELDDLEDA